MRCLGLIIAALGMLATPLEAAVPDGTWMVSQRVAVDLYGCGQALCGRLAWLRNPALRTPALCGRTIVWGLRPDGDQNWTGGWFYDPENGRTYNVKAQVETPDSIRARIYAGIAWFGRTEMLTRIAPRSLAGWCG